MTAGELELVVQYGTNECGAPAKDFIETCVRGALIGVNGELVVRIVDESESAALNERYRDKRGPTNVLAFPAGEMPATESQPKQLGDIAICAAIVAREAEGQGKSLKAHWAHIVIHGCLHLCGFDHEVELDAKEMEARERVLLAKLGVDDPYAGER